MNAPAPRQEVALPEPDAATAIIQVIERAAMNPAVDIDKMERLLQMQERIVERQAEASYNEAMSAAQAELEIVRKDAANPQTKSRYASFAALDRACRPTYTRHGFALSYDTGDGAPPEHVRVVCHVSHRGGHSRTHHVDMPADGKGAKGGDVMTKTHATGAALTYGQRYLLKLIFNIAVGEDDDGNAAGQGGGFVTAAQAQQIARLIVDVGANRETFLNYLGVPTLEQIHERDFAKAVAALNKKREQRRG